MEQSTSSSDTPLMMNVDSFDTMDTIETILDETMAVDDIAALTQKKGLFKRFRSRSSKRVKKEEGKEQKSKGRKLMSRLSFGNKRSQAKLVVVETRATLLASSYTVASEDSPMHQDEDEQSAESKESEVPTSTSTAEEVVEVVSHTVEEIVEVLSHTEEEIVEAVTPDVSATASSDDVTTANETLQEIVDLQEAVEVPEIERASQMEVQNETVVVDDKDEVILQVVSIKNDDLVLTMEFDEDEVETSSEEFIEEIMPEKAPYHQDSADYVGLALVGLLVTLLASPIFQS